MKITLTLPLFARKMISENKLILEFEENQVYLKQVLESIAAQYGEEIKHSLCDKQGRLTYHLFVNGKSWDPCKPIKDGAQVAMLDIVLGG